MGLHHRGYENRPTEPGTRAGGLRAQPVARSSRGSVPRGTPLPASPA